MADDQFAVFIIRMIVVVENIGERIAEYACRLDKRDAIVFLAVDRFFPAIPGKPDGYTSAV
jgi:hypothetical protein